MYAKNIELDEVNVSSQTEDLKLSATPSLHLLLPAPISSLGSERLLQALKSGKIWIFRGRPCRLELQLSFNGKPLDLAIRDRILEGLGCQLRDAHVGRLFHT